LRQGQEKTCDEATDRGTVKIHIFRTGSAEEILRRFE
jgi:hypothetical protein